MKQSYFSIINRRAIWVVWGLFVCLMAIIVSALVILVITSNTSREIALDVKDLPTNTITPTTPPILSTSAPTNLPIILTATVRPTETILPTPTDGEPFPIGYSVEGNPLEVYRFGSGSKVHMIVGAIHGGYENNTAELIHQLIVDLKTGHIVVPEDVTLYLLPIFNPDGYKKYLKQPEGRPNAHGVDLNRNFGVFWQKDWNRAGCFNAIPTTAGEFPFSEPETKSLREFVTNNRVIALISYHSARSAIYAGGQPKPDKESDSLAHALASTSPYLYPPTNDLGCQYTGQLIDWASENGIAAVDVELRNHKDMDLEINRAILRAFLAWQH